MIARSSRLGDPTVYSLDAFPEIALLQREWRTIRSELGLLPFQHRFPAIEEISPDHARIARERRWRSFFLVSYGYRSPLGLATCPKTSALLDGISGLETAFFSVLTPSAHLPLHKGVTKALITCHLPLIVPENCGALRVGNEERPWVEGEMLIFDDTIEHEAWNNSDQERVILLFEIWRPEIGEEERGLITTLLKAIKEYS